MRLCASWSVTFSGIYICRFHDTNRVKHACLHISSKPKGYVEVFLDSIAPPQRNPHPRRNLGKHEKITRDRQTFHGQNDSVKISTNISLKRNTETLNNLKHTQQKMRAHEFRRRCTGYPLTPQHSPIMRNRYGVQIRGKKTKQAAYNYMIYELGRATWNGTNFSQGLVVRPSSHLTRT